MSDTAAGNRWLRRVSILLRVVAGLVVIAIGLSIFSFLVATTPKPPRKPIDAVPLAVRAIRTVPVEVESTWEGYGTARSPLARDIPAQLSARVVERPAAIEPGLPVRRGDLILRLDDADVRAVADAARENVASLSAQIDGLDAEARRWSDQLELAQDDADRERRELERTIEALSLGAATEAEADRRRAGVSRLEREIASIRQALDVVPSRRASLLASRLAEEARLAAAVENLARTRILAPIDGTLQEIAVREGEMVTPGMRVARVVDLARIEVPLLLPMSAGSEVVPGSAVALWRDTRAEAAWQGQVARLAPEADPGTRTLAAYVVVDQDPAARDVLRPGQFVVGRVRIPAETPRLVVPRRIVEDGRVFVAERAGESTVARARRVTVMFHVEHSFPTLDPGESQWAVVASGLEPGDVVIVSNIADLREGLPVEPRAGLAAEDPR